MGNGIKINGSLKVIITIATLALMIAGGGVAWGMLNGKVDTNKENISEIKDDLRVIRQDIKELLNRVPEKE